MTNKEFLIFHREAIELMHKICQQKNSDYTSDSGDAFYNFSRVEALGIASTEQGFITRMLDKFCRIISFVKKGNLEVKDESVEDTLLDLANYCILLAGFLRNKRAQLPEAGKGSCAEACNGRCFK